MKKTLVYFSVMLAMAVTSVPVLAQSADRFTGTVLSYGTGRDTRVRTGTFDLILTNTTSKSEAERLMKILDEDGQDKFLDEIKRNDFGKFSIGSSVGPTVNFVLDDMVDGKQRIIVIFQRWMHFAEFRYGYSSTDYPFGMLEMIIDPETGKGEGTFIGAARLNWRLNKRTQESEMRVEGFAAFPSRLLSIKQTAKRLP